MTRILKITILLMQIGITLILNSALYLLFAMFEYEGGIANFIGMTLIQPIAAIITSIFTIIACLILGIPIRNIKKLNNWWRTNFYISIMIAISGVLLCITSILPEFIEEINYTMEGINFTKEVPNQILSITGWFLVAFGTLHSYPPKFIQDKFENYIKDFTG